MKWDPPPDTSEAVAQKAAIHRLNETTAVSLAGALGSSIQLYNVRPSFSISMYLKSVSLQPTYILNPCAQLHQVSAEVGTLLVVSDIDPHSF